MSPSRNIDPAQHPQSMQADLGPKSFAIGHFSVCQSELESNKTSDWPNIWFGQSEVVLHSNVFKSRKIWKARL